MWCADTATVFFSSDVVAWRLFGIGTGVCARVFLFLATSSVFQIEGVVGRVLHQ